MKRVALRILATTAVFGLMAGVAVAADKTEWTKVTGPNGIVIECQSGRADVAKDLIPEITKRVKDNDDRIAQIKKTTKTMSDKQEEVLQFLAKQIAISSPRSEMRQILSGVPAAMVEQMLASAPKVSEVKIWDVETARAVLASGKEIPGLALDPQTKEVQHALVFRMGFDVNKSGGNEVNAAPHKGDVVASNQLMVLVKSTTKAEAIKEAIKQLDDTAQLYDNIVPTVLGASIHEAAEIGIIQSYNLVTPYRRWFCDGMANYLAWKCLGDVLGDKEAAAKFLSTYDSTKCDPMKDQVDLRYWKAAEFENTSPEPRNVVTEPYAYAFATKEVMGIAERHGADCIPAIFKEIAKTKQPLDDTLLDAIQTVTKDDMRAILDKYGAKTPKDKWSRMAARGIFLGTTDPNVSDENTKANETKKLPLIQDGRHGVWVRMEYVTSEQPVAFKMELVGPAKSDGQDSGRVVEAQLNQKYGGILRGYMFGDAIDQPGKYTIKIYLECKHFKDVDFEVVATDKK